MFSTTMEPTIKSTAIGPMMVTIGIMELRNAWRALALIAESRQDSEQATAAWKQAALVD